MNSFLDLDFDERLAVFEKAMELRKSGLGYKRITKAVFNELNIQIPYSTLAYWCKNKIQLLGGENQFTPEPSPELSYVLGVCFGDAGLVLDSRKSDYKLVLETIDNDFAEKFSQCGSKVLKKTRNYSINYSAKRQIYATKARSKQLYYFVKSVKENFELVKPIAEKFPAEFIQGVADSEGCPAISAAKNFKVAVCVAYSANYELLEYIQQLLLHEFSIVSALRLFKLPGMADSIINGRIIVRTKKLYCLSITSKLNVENYFSKVGFSIARKQSKFSDAISILSLGENEALNWWHLHYVKIGKQWKKIDENNIRQLS
ncbi:MAG: LAGLIDADG family homing endonuclease [Candidatus Diapherotrites archaeon]|nr:LAGLIDADG family homing endonuclease [Candidatus Diapherotrites archaeon]